MGVALVRGPKIGGRGSGRSKEDKKTEEKGKENSKRAESWE